MTESTTPDQGSVFNSEVTAEPTKVTANQDSTPTGASSSDQMSAFIGENKKYATVEAALSSIEHSQNHIAKLEAENASIKAAQEELRKELSKRQTAEEIISKMGEAKQKQTQSAEFDLESVTRAAREAAMGVLSQNKIEETMNNNELLVSRALQNTYGAEVMDKLTSKAAKLGMSIADLQEMSRSKPAVVLEMFGLDSTSASARVPTKTKGSVNQESLSSQMSPQQPRKSIMGASNSQTLRDAWRSAGENIKNN